jgi:predicted PurR-regulated permease PerM
MRQPKMLPGLVLDMAPVKYRRRLMRSMLRARELLYRYFIGILLKVVTLGFVAGLGLWIAGVEGAVFFGLVFGFLDVIPYLGPLLSSSFTALVATAYELNQPDPMLGWLWLKLVAVYIVAQITDNIILEPFIYGSSIRAHPLEVFLVILIAGHLAGIPGMVLGIPVYTVLRVLAAEFLAGYPVVERITARMNNAAAGNSKDK